MMPRRSRAVSEDIEKLVKKANQRLRELEKQGLANSSEAYQYIMNKANKNLAGKTKVKMFATTSKGQIKFRTDLATLKKAKNTYKAMIKAVEGFLEAKTSTRTGISEKNKQTYESFKNTTGFSGSFAEFDDLWKNSEFVELTKRFGVSDTIAMMDSLQDMLNSNDLHLSESDIIHEMYVSGKTSNWGMYDYFMKKYNISSSDYEDIDEDWSDIPF